ncbi:RluA family pseudouridine synthase [Sphingomonas bacterium]|uniref:RluA family pseudouridine synthase n=1 Tax=Sphingomonas bacterium TaxID=1895847 RepID=UPI0015755DD4|nr:RNA pseudouridine synthase [Sphingomonas bacterium]
MIPTILYEDGEALVIDKRAGLPVDPPRAGGPSVEALLPTLRLGFARAPSITHRLDRDTSGCLLLARHPKAQRRFMAAFEGGRVEKAYLAIVHGLPEATGGVIDRPLAKVSTREAGWRIVVDRKGKPARTRWTMLAERDGHSLLLFQPDSGRTHQLRVHAASGIGLPILGDPVYGKAGRTAESAGLMLHAWRLTVPRDGKTPIAATAPFPDRFAAFGFTDPGDGG